MECEEKRLENESQVMEEFHPRRQHNNRNSALHNIRPPFFSTQ